MPRRSLRFLRKDRTVELSAFSPSTTLLDYLRLSEKSCGTKEGCAEGDCGACTVVLARATVGGIRYEPVNACILLLGQVDGAQVITIEDLANSGKLHPVQQAMLTHHGSQCGFCTPGIVMSLFALYHEAARPVATATVNDTLAGNLCRCTGYRPIRDAAAEACADIPSDQFQASETATHSALDALTAEDQDISVGDETSFFASPASIETLAALYLAHPDATLVSGATDVGLWITKRLADLKKIIWLGRVADFATITESSDRLLLGAGVTHTEALPALGRIHADLLEIGRRFGSQQVRASGTIGGNIANGSPIGDWAPCLIALGATMTLQRGEDTRDMPVEAFFLGYGRQDRAASEFVRAVSVPKLAENQHFRAFKVSKRFDEDISAVMLAMLVELEGPRVVSARIAFGGMAGNPKRAAQVEAALIGLAVTDRAGIARAAARVAGDFQPLSDARASAAYRLKLAENLIVKALLEISGTQPALTRILEPARRLHAAG